MSTKAMAIALGLAACGAPAAAAQTHWITSWGASQQVPEPNNALAPERLTDATIRQIVHLSTGGGRLRIKLSNAFGTQPLVIDGAHVARATAPGKPDTVAGSGRALLFAGQPGVTIPAGADYLSDPIDMAVPTSGDIAVSIHQPVAPAGQSGHPGSRATSWSAKGDQSAAATLNGAEPFEHWTELSGIEVAAPAAAATVVALGDSITDGHGSTTNGNDRWPDLLAKRFAHDPVFRSWGVSNQGIGGNHLLTDGLGPNALARFDRDVLAQAGVRTVIVFEGVNDLGMLSREETRTPAQHADLVARMTAAYTQMIERAHAHGLRIVGGTITPYVGSDYYHPDAASEADRQVVNAWIRAAGQFDAVIDFDRAVRDPAHPDRLRADFDCGDHLHPSPAGYKAMADAVPLAILR